MALSILAFALRFQAVMAVAALLIRPLLSVVPGQTASSTTFGLASLIMLIPVASASWGLLKLGDFGRRVGRSGPFDGSGATALSQAGISLLAAAMLLPPTRILAAWVGQTGTSFTAAFSAALTMPSVLAVFVGVALGLTLLVLAATLRQSIALLEENRAFV